MKTERIIKLMATQNCANCPLKRTINGMIKADTKIASELQKLFGVSDKERDVNSRLNVLHVLNDQLPR